MNLSWTALTAGQRAALSQLCERQKGELHQELGEQLSNLGLAEQLSRGHYSISQLGLTIVPAARQG